MRLLLPILFSVWSAISASSSTVHQTVHPVVIDQICNIYERQLEKLFIDFSAFDMSMPEISRYVFTSDFLNCEANEKLAEAVSKGVSMFLAGSTLQVIIPKSFPVKRLKTIFEMYPLKFIRFFDFNDMFEHIQCKFLILQEDPIDHYFAYRLNRGAYYTYFPMIDFTRISLKGYLLAARLMLDKVDTDYMHYMHKHVNGWEIQMVPGGTRDQVWASFMIELPKTKVQATLKLLLCKRHAKEVIKRCLAYKSSLVVKNALLISHRKGKGMDEIVPVIIPDDLREHTDYGISSATDISAEDGGQQSDDRVDHFSQLCRDLLLEIFMACAKNDFEHTLMVLPQVSQKLNNLVNADRLASLRIILCTSAKAAIRFINDTNQRPLDPARFKLGSPEFAEIITLFVHAMTAHPEKLLTVDSLYADYIRGFPYLRSKIGVLNRVYCRWPEMINHILSEYPFVDAQQYGIFARRAALISPSPVIFPHSFKLPAKEMVNVLETLLDDAAVVLKLYFSSDAILSLLEALNFTDPLIMLRKFLPKPRKNAHLKGQLCFSALCQRHFGGGGVPMEVLENLVKRAATWFTPADISNKDFILNHLRGHPYPAFKYEGDEILEHISFAIIDGRVEAGTLSDRVIDDCTRFICSRRSPTLFRVFVERVIAMGFQPAAITTPMFHYFLQYSVDCCG